MRGSLWRARGLSGVGADPGEVFGDARGDGDGEEDGDQEDEEEERGAGAGDVVGGEPVEDAGRPGNPAAEDEAGKTMNQNLNSARTLSQRTSFWPSRVIALNAPSWDTTKPRL